MTATEEAQEYQVRTFRPGDETEVVGLFNKVHERFAGFVPRTPEFWDWCFRARPDVMPEGIPIIEYRDRIVGYAVVGKRGDIWEFCYDPSSDGKIVVSTLLRWVMRYANDNGSNSVRLNAPSDDWLLREVCDDLGFTELPARFSLVVSVIDLPRLIREIANHNAKARDGRNRQHEVFLFRLRNAPPWHSNLLTISLGEEILVHEGETGARDVSVTTDIPTVMSCIFGVMRASNAIVSRRLKVQPVWKVPRVLDLFSLLRLEDPWYVPGGDFG